MDRRVLRILYGCSIVVIESVPNRCDDVALDVARGHDGADPKIVGKTCDRSHDNSLHRFRTQEDA
jgi:hypothetical protein